MELACRQAAGANRVAAVAVREEASRNWPPVVVAVVESTQGLRLDWSDKPVVGYKERADSAAMCKKAVLVAADWAGRGAKNWYWQICRTRRPERSRHLAVCSLDRSIRLA